MRKNLEFDTKVIETLAWWIEKIPMSLPPIAEKIKSTLAFLLAWAFLNVLMNIKYPAQQQHLLTLFKVSPEVLGIMMIPLAAACMGLRFHPALYLPLTAFVMFLRLFRIGDILVPMFFFRPFNLFLQIVK